MENNVTHSMAKRGSGVSILLAGLLAISACSDNSNRIYEASNAGGDYTVLDCEQLRVAQLSIDQRLGGTSNYSTVGEPTVLLESQRNSIAPIRQSRQCPGGSTVNAVTPAQVAADAPDAALVESAFLQVATFRETSNRDNLVAKLSADGFPVQVRPITLAGNVYNRVVVGPLTKVSEIARIDATILKMGLADAFFLKR